MSWKSDLKDWMDKYDAKNPANNRLTRQVENLNIYIKQLEEEIKQLDKENRMNNMFILHHQIGIINLGLVVYINKVYDKHNKVVCRLYYADKSHLDIEDYYWDIIMEKLAL